MNLNEFAKEVHALAVEKGFYDEQPEVEIPEGDFKSAYRPTARFNSEGFESGASDAELIAAIHSEISEAFEEWRAGRPMVWHKCRYSDLPCAGKGCNCRNVNCENSAGQEPHGVAVELIDVALRILDAAAAWDIELQESYWSSSDPYRYADQFYLTPRSIVEAYVLPELVCELHYLIDELYLMRRTRQDAQDIATKMSIPVYLIYTWLHAHDIDPEALLLEKHEYNKTRPYRHGGKRV